MYVEGFLLPVKTARKADYERIAREAAAIFREYGALRVVECWAEDVKVGDLTSFPRAVKLEEDETAVFSWIEYPDRATRDRCNERVFADPRMQMEGMDDIIDGKRMIFGGFETLVDG